MHYRLLSKPGFSGAFHYLLDEVETRRKGPIAPFTSPLIDLEDEKLMALLGPDAAATPLSMVEPAGKGVKKKSNSIKDIKVEKKETGTEGLYKGREDLRFHSRLLEYEEKKSLRVRQRAESFSNRYCTIVQLSCLHMA